MEGLSLCLFIYRTPAGVTLSECAFVYIGLSLPLCFLIHRFLSSIVPYAIHIPTHTHSSIYIYICKYISFLYIGFSRWLCFMKCQVSYCAFLYIESPLSVPPETGLKSLRISAECTSREAENLRWVDRKNPPPRGGSPIWQVPLTKNPEAEDPPQNLYQMRPGRSSSSGFLFREPAK